MTAGTQRMQLPGLKGLRVAITAGGGGIGLAIACELKGQGARLAICDVDASALERASKELGAEVERLADVSNVAQVADFLRILKQQWAGWNRW